MISSPYPSDLKCYLVVRNGGLFLLSTLRSAKYKIHGCPDLIDLEFSTFKDAQGDFKCTARIERYHISTLLINLYSVADSPILDSPIIRVLMRTFSEEHKQCSAAPVIFF